MGRLNNKVVLITGGTQSIGKSIAEVFLEHDAKVIISGSRSPKDGDQIAKSLGHNAAYLKLNVTEESDWQKAMEFIQNAYGKLDVLINNAGLEHPPHATDLQNPEECSLADWNYVHRVNLDGVFLGCKYAISLMKKNENCAIVNIGSRCALVGFPTSAAYTSSKAAVRNYTKTVALYCAQKKYSIRCNVIHPAAIFTPMWDKELGEGEARTAHMKALCASIPLGHMGKPEDVAYAALYLSSDESLFITGTEIVVDGGITAGSGALEVDLESLVS